MTKIFVKKKRKILQGAELEALSQAVTKNERAAVEVLKNGRKFIADLNITRSAQSSESLAGIDFEEFHKISFNHAARKSGDYVTTAKTGFDIGTPNHERVDITIVAGKKTLAEVQAKCCKSPMRNAASVSDPKYAGTDRLVPADQASAVKATLANSAIKKANSINPKNHIKAQHRAEASSRVTDRIKANGHESKPLKHAEALELAKGNFQKLDGMIQMYQFKTAVKGGAISGATVGGAFSAISNTYATLKGEKFAKQALVDVALETTTSALRGATTAVMTEGFKTISKNIFAKEAAKTILKGSTLAAFVGCVHDMASDAAKGNLTKERAAKNVGRAGSAWAGAETGAIFGTFFGPVGTLLGGIAGGVVFSMGFDALFD